ncbi:hypothetical protein [Vibrio anguillarum]|nr:hypothetical protein [Vibrio anguillarum]
MSRAIKNTKLDLPQPVNRVHYLNLFLGNAGLLEQGNSPTLA